MSTAKLKRIHTAKANVSKNHVSQAIQTTAHNWIFCSGQLPIDPETGNMPATAAEQTLQILENLNAVVIAAGATKSSIVKTTIFVTDLAESAEINTAYKAFFGTHMPARSQVEVAGLANNAKLEIECIAVV